MKINRTFLALIFAALILFAASIYSAKIAQQFRNDEEAKCIEEIKNQIETECKPRFWYSTDDDIDRNYVDYIAIGLFIFATSTTVAAIWIRKLNK